MNEIVVGENRMYERDIYIYGSMQSWLDEAPDAVLRGTVSNIGPTMIEVVDENNLHQLINIERLFAVVY